VGSIGNQLILSEASLLEACQQGIDGKSEADRLGATLLGHAMREVTIARGPFNIRGETAERDEATFRDERAEDDREDDTTNASNQKQAAQAVKR
jgi:hypothetical protein